MIKLRFVTGNDFVSRSPTRMALYTSRRVEAIMPDGTWLGAHLDGGVQARPAEYDRATRTRELIVEIDAGNWAFAPNATAPVLSGPRENRFHDFLRAQVGKPYDLTAIAGLALGRDWRTPDSWICSELQAAALEACGYLPKLSAADNHISPRDLLLVLSGRVPIADAA
jgi:hypothetical protein